MNTQFAKSLRMLTLTATAAITGLSGLAFAESHLPTNTALSDDEAFVLVSVRDLSPRLSSLALTDNRQKLKLKLGPNETLQLIKVKAGTYTAKQENFGKQRGIVVTPGTVTYIGDWTLMGKQNFRVNGKLVATEHENHRVQYNVDKLRDFSHQNAWIKQYPLTISNVDGKRVINEWNFGEEKS